MTILVLLCLSLLDFQHLPKSVNPFAKFVVVDAVDPTAMSGCTMNPSQGRPANVMIDQHAAGPQIKERAALALPLGCNDPLPFCRSCPERCFSDPDEAKGFNFPEWVGTFCQEARRRIFAGFRLGVAKTLEAVKRHP